MQVAASALHPGPNRVRRLQGPRVAVWQCARRTACADRTPRRYSGWLTRERLDEKKKLKVRHATVAQNYLPRAADAPRSSQEQPQFVTLGDGMMARFEIGKKGEAGKVPDQTIKSCAGTFPVQADTVAARRPRHKHPQPIGRAGAAALLTACSLRTENRQGRPSLLHSAITVLRKPHHHPACADKGACAIPTHKLLAPPPLLRSLQRAGPQPGSQLAFALKTGRATAKSGSRTSRCSSRRARRSVQCRYRCTSLWQGMDSGGRWKGFATTRWNVARSCAGHACRRCSKSLFRTQRRTRTRTSATVWARCRTRARRSAVRSASGQRAAPVLARLRAAQGIDVVICGAGAGVGAGAGAGAGRGISTSRSPRQTSGAGSPRRTMTQATASPWRMRFRTAQACRGR